MDDRAMEVEKKLETISISAQTVERRKNTIFFFQRYFGRGWIRYKREREGERDKGKKDVPSLKPGSFLYIF